MVDASVGGKVAVDRPEAKNLVGAFYQPRIVFADVSMLGTLPERELVSGWAEVIKHALALSPTLLDGLEDDADALLALDPAAMTETVRQSMALKAQVVAEDERELTGGRSILNYGHTIGHALEAATGYNVMLHGEAVAWGMAGAAELGRRLGITSPELVERQNALLRRFGLLGPIPPVSVDSLLAAISLDKKVVGTSVRWVLLSDAGQPMLRGDVPLELVREVLQEMLSEAPKEGRR
jgi:3-dehydroquinate synthase